jgi:hypothetical protein
MTRLAKLAERLAVDYPFGEALSSLFEAADIAASLDLRILLPMSGYMATESEMYRRHAQEQRDEAEKTSLPNVRARALHAADRWDLMAERAEYSESHPRRQY